jgi:peptidoglycan/xylan/chitin deacetylase (PgdA/CDA1 family)
MGSEGDESPRQAGLTAGMRTPPIFIMSLDCEGKWGMADSLQPYHHQKLTNRKLANAYQQLLDVLSRHDISATFAFVMAFTLTEAERENFAVLDRHRNAGDPWLRHYWASLDAGLGEGWHVPEALDRVREDGRHEIASHSFCHRRLADGSIDADGAAAELADAAAAARLTKTELKTLVFPGNQVGNLRVVKSAGYLGYRSRLDRANGKLGRAMALLEEFDTRARPQEPLPDCDGLVAIPSGRFFNWRFGLRRLIPSQLTMERWKGQLDQCVRDSGIVHLWLHPHNLITGPGTAAVLSDVLAYVALLRDQGLLQVMTQLEYCERMIAAKAA